MNAFHFLYIFGIYPMNAWLCVWQLLLKDLAVYISVCYTVLAVLNTYLTNSISITWGFPSQSINQPRGHDHKSDAWGITPEWVSNQEPQDSRPAYKPLRYSRDHHSCIVKAKNGIQ
jgi:hypothetical protein